MRGENKSEPKKKWATSPQKGPRVRSVYTHCPSPRAKEAGVLFYVATPSGSLTLKGEQQVRLETIQKGSRDPERTPQGTFRPPGHFGRSRSSSTCSRGHGRRPTWNPHTLDLRGTAFLDAQKRFCYLSVGQNPVFLANIKTSCTWVFSQNGGT